MESIKRLFIYIILIWIFAISEAAIIRGPSSSRPSNAQTSLRRNYSGRVNPSAFNSARTRVVHAQRPNVAPIRPGYPARLRDFPRFQAPIATSWRGLQSSQPQRELIFASPKRNMRERSGPARDHPKERHSRRHNHKLRRTEALRKRGRNVYPVRPHFTTEKPTAAFRRRNPTFGRSNLQSSRSQQKHTFISPPRLIRKNPTTAKTNLRRNYYNRMRSQGTDFKRTQALRSPRPDVYSNQPDFTTRKPLALFRRRTSEFSARS